MIGLSVFLSAYDPSDLPGDSIDPLGFERGYLYLAEKILPGLTNVASKPRYFGMLCAGISLANAGQDVSPTTQFQRRLETVLRLERLWALANVLVRNAEHDGTYPVGGIRGLRYVERKAEQLARKGALHTTADFPVLARQQTYGAIGMYGAVAERLRIVHDRKTLSLTPDLGDKLASAFIEETHMPSGVRLAVRDDRPVALDVLRKWGERAHVSAEVGEEEAECLNDAMHRNPMRSRMASLLETTPQLDGEAEIDRLERVLQQIGGDPVNLDIAECLEAISAYERAYALAQLALERLLWLSRSHPSLPISVAAADDVVGLVCRQISAAAARFDEAVRGAMTEHARRDAHRVDDVRSFLLDLGRAANSPIDLIRCVLARHADIQRGKFDKGRRKAPWIALNDDVLSLTTMRAGGASFEVDQPGEIVPHFYRTVAADALRDSGAAA